MLKLCASNLAWPAAADEEMYACLSALGFCGLEIAPTRLFPEAPYEKCAAAAAFAARLYETYGLRAASMQSIWYGRTERIFESSAARASLLAYTKRAIDFAHALGCGTLVFGCPRNRRLEPGEDRSAAADFFCTLGAYADANGAALALEPNPAVYGTNFLNTPAETAAYTAALGTAGVEMNWDTGAALQDDTPLSVFEACYSCVRHIHISEIGLAPVAERPIHAALLAAAEARGYAGYVSIETADHGAAAIRRACEYLQGLEKRLHHALR